MDELEISGKRFISAKRAAQENKYTPDYIGQLIRGKKVVGQKVGRAWYVEAKSLAAYLNGASLVVEDPALETTIEELANIEQAPVFVEEAVVENVIEQPIAEVVAVAQPEEVVQEIEIIETKKEVIDESVEQKHTESYPEEVRVPLTRVSAVEQEEEIELVQEEVARPRLQYITDDSFALPVLQKRSVVEEVEEQYQPAQEVRVPKNAKSRSYVGSVFTLGAVALIVVGASLFVSSKLATQIQVEQGQPASVGIVFK